jgi:hypothetical protein
VRHYRGALGEHCNHSTVLILYSLYCTPTHSTVLLLYSLYCTSTVLLLYDQVKYCTVLKDRLHTKDDEEDAVRTEVNEETMSLVREVFLHVLKVSGLRVQPVQTVFQIHTLLDLLFDLCMCSRPSTGMS